MLVSRPLTIPKILGGKARGRKKARMATKWDKASHRICMGEGLNIDNVVSWASWAVSQLGGRPGRSEDSPMRKGSFNAD
jgi:hypothetical protein